MFHLSFFFKLDGSHRDLHSFPYTTRFRSVLTYIPPTFEQQVASYVEQELKSGTPITMVINKLKSQGLDNNQATSAVNNIVGDDIVTCHHCHMDFLKGIEKCSLCEECI